MNLTSEIQNVLGFNEPLIYAGAYSFLYQCVSMDFSFEIINDTRVLRQWLAPNGAAWCLVEMRKSNVNKYRSIFERIYNEYYKFYLEDTGQ